MYGAHHGEVRVSGEVWVGYTVLDTGKYGVEYPSTMQR